ncbi:hypothetical protein S7335_775 [Synechococcus sp. PCC 7335]|nr:hypothetical protein S7335_295 [Synechococcus sp. PCC 7335]EDX83595.1 hypothetical protein S7335_775 [Synechococcus sp. PCC 7335]
MHPSSDSFLTRCQWQSCFTEQQGDRADREVIVEIALGRSREVYSSSTESGTSYHFSGKLSSQL